MTLPPFSPAAARELRESMGYTQQQMADALCMTQRSSWARFEHPGSDRVPSPQTWLLALIIAGRHPLYGPREGAAAPQAPAAP